MNFRLGGSKRKGLDDEDSIVKRLSVQAGRLVSSDIIKPMKMSEPMGKVFYLDFPDNNDLDKYVI